MAEEQPKIEWTTGTNERGETLVGPMLAIQKLANYTLEKNNSIEEKEDYAAGILWGMVTVARKFSDRGENIESIAPMPDQESHFSGFNLSHEFDIAIRLASAFIEHGFIRREQLVEALSKVSEKDVGDSRLERDRDVLTHLLRNPSIATPFLTNEGVQNPVEYYHLPATS